MATDIITLGIACDSKDVVTASQNLDKLPGSAKRAEDATSSLGSKFAGLGKYISAATAALSVLGLGVFVKECMDASLQLERLNKLFNAAAGSASLAGREMAFVKDMANRLGLEITSTAESYGKFLAAIRGTSLEGEKGRKVFESVSGAATALGLRVDETSGIFNALQQMMSKGTVQAEELRGQLGERLPGAFKMAADAMGVSTAELDKMLAQGLVLADDLLPKLAVELDKTYGKAAVEGAHSAQAEINRMNNAMFDTKAAAGAALVPAFIAILNAIQPVLGMIKSFIQATQEAGVYWGAFYDKVTLSAGTVFKKGWLGLWSDEYKAALGNIESAKSAQMAEISRQYQKSSADYANAMRKWQTPKSTTTGTQSSGKPGKSSAKTASDEAEKAAQSVENWRKTYSDLQLEIDKLNPAFDEHAQKLKEIDKKYTDLERKKGANIKKLEELRKALIAATEAEYQAKLEAEQFGLMMEELNSAMDKYKAMMDKVNSLQPDFDFKQVTAEMKAIIDDSIRFGDEFPATAEKAANAINSLAADYADKMVSNMRAAQQEAKELADIIRQNVVDAADLKAAKAMDDSRYRLFGGNDAIDAQLEAEKTAIHARYAAEQQAIQDQMDQINLKRDAEIQAIDTAHKAAMSAIEEETRAKYADNEPMLKEALAKQAAAEREYQKRIDETRAKDAKKINATLAAMETTRTTSRQKEQQEIDDAEKVATRQKLNMYSDYAGATASLFSAMADAQDQSSRKGFETAKAFNLAAAVMSTAAGIMNQYSSGDPYTANFRAAIVAAVGAIQIAQIMSTSYGGGSNSVKAPSGSFNSGSSESSMTSSSGIGSKIGTQYSSVYDQQTTESLQALADSADSASLAIGRVADGLTDISSLFDDEDSYLSLASKSLSSASIKEPAMSFTDVLEQNYKLPLTELKGIGNTFTGLIDNGINMIKLIDGALFGGKWYTKSAGIALSMTGTDVDVDDYLYRKKSGGVFGKTKKKYVYSDNDAWTDIIQTVIDSVTATISHAAVAMGTTTNYSAASMDLTRIKTTGESEEDIAKELQSWLESASNELAKTVDGLKEYTFYNENAFDALVRLSTALQSTNEGLELIGATLIDSTLAGANAAYLLQEVMGGAEEFADAIDTYFSSMFTDAEQDAMLAAQATRQVNTAFGEMGATVPQTKEQFRELVNSLDLNTESGASMFDALMDVSEAFGTAIDYATEFAKAQNDLNNDAQVRIMELTGREDEAEILSLQLQHQQELRDAQEHGLDVTTLLTAQALELADAYKQQSDAAAETAAELTENRRQLNLQIMRLLGNESGAMAIERQAELDAMDASLRPLQERINSLTDEKAATEAAAALQKTNSKLMVTLLDLQGKSAESLALKRQLETAGMDASTLAIQQQIYALQDMATTTDAASTAFEGAKTALKTAIDAELESLKTRADATAEALSEAEALLDRSYSAQRDIIVSQHDAIISGLQAGLDEATDTASALSSAVDRLKSARESMTLDNAGTQASAYSQAQYDLQSVIAAAKRGDTSGLDNIDSTLSTLTSLTTDSFSNSTDYQRTYYQTYNAISELETLAGNQLTDAQKQVTYLESLLTTTQTNHEATLAAFDAELNSIKGIEANTVPIEEARMKYEATKTANMVAQRELETQTEYMNAQYNELCNINSSVLSVADAISRMQMLSLPGYASGGVTSGLSYAGEAGPEAVVPLPDGRTIPVRISGPVAADNKDLLDEIKALRAEIRAVAANTKKTADYSDKWDVDGMPEVRAA